MTLLSAKVIMISIIFLSLGVSCIKEQSFVTLVFVGCATYTAIQILAMK